MPYVRKASLPAKPKSRKALPAPADAQDLRSEAAAKIEATYHASIEAIAAEQVRLALEAENEGVRMKAGQKIIEHVKGAPTQRIESKSLTARIVTHMPVPGFEVEPASPILPPANDHAGVTASPARKALPKFRAASSPATGRSTYGLPVITTNVKTSKPMDPVPDPPEPKAVK